MLNLILKLTLIECFIIGSLNWDYKSFSFLLISGHLNCRKFQGFLLEEFGRSFKMFLEMSEKEKDCREIMVGKAKLSQAILLRYYHQKKYVQILMKKVCDMDKQMARVDAENFFLENINSELQEELDYFKERIWNVYGCLK